MITLRLKDFLTPTRVAVPLAAIDVDARLSGLLRLAAPDASRHDAIRALSRWPSDSNVIAALRGARSVTEFPATAHRAPSL